MPRLGLGVLFVAGGLPIDDEITFLIEACILTVVIDMGVNMRSALPLRASGFFVVAQAPAEVVGLADINRLPSVRAELLGKYVVTGLVHEAGFDRVDPILIHAT